MLAHGIPDPVLGAQVTFRAVMNATARPGSIQEILTVATAPKPLSPGAAAVALTLCDYETPVWLDRALVEANEVGRWITFHTGAPISSSMRDAAFAFVSDPLLMPGLDAFALGMPDYPDRSSTIVVQVESFSSGEELLLAGPGIAKIRKFSASPSPVDFRHQLQANHSLFPRGVDCLFVTDVEIAAIPRSTRVIEGE